MKLNITASAARLRRLLSAGALVLGLTATATAQGTGFTYQGRLDSGGVPYSGTAHFRPTLWDDLDSGTQLAINSPPELEVAVTNGLFVLLLDFGANSQFPGADRWLQLKLRIGNEQFTTVLTPRQKITATPYAITAGGVSGSVAASQVMGFLPVSQVSGTMPLEQLPTSVVTNGASGVNITGTFTGNVSGNGAGLTNLPASTVATPPPGMVLIPTGSFTMGNSIAADTDITDAATVTATVSAFYMDVNLVTLSQWQSVYYWATNHGYGFVNVGAGKAANHPVQTVSWYDCVKWCNARSQQAGRTPVYYTDAGLTAVYTNGEPTTLYPNWVASGYRLPTEAEWEKAARGGLSGQRFPWGNVINQNLANYYGNTDSYAYDLGPNGYNAIGSVGGTSPATSPVGSFAANGYGLNDMAGNVLEWCWDWYETTYDGGSDPHGPAGPSSLRVLRGGDWDYYAYSARCAYRNGYSPYNASSYFGFRCVRGL
ncbi:MAG: SUMF1/EgtB/PvdO family nonheme iron enzyme [Verrucomicrobia bacterium]|nr:SUMF1/EgtB/PvdO family nonheme iron enzyme [Verrucomicrobiota bacterium]